jgi:peptidoglycan/xylan/chitin deacetylase (PgdA/CDA1 family)
VILAPTLAAVGLLALVGVYLSPQLAKTAQIRALRQQCRATRSLALTYDDGPGAELTPALLELLAAAGARATFFPTGRSATRDPELLTRVAAAGHEVGCHSQDHLHAWRTAPWLILRDIDAGYRTLARWVSPAGLYRPPYGKTTLATWWRARRRHARLAWWTVDSGDTHAVLPTPQTIVEAVRRDGGGVVLMHDFDRDPPNDEPRETFVLELTEQLLKAARGEGWRVCRLGELLEETRWSAALAR